MQHGGIDARLQARWHLLGLLEEAVGKLARGLVQVPVPRVGKDQVLRHGQAQAAHVG
ncbi:hypothetical protein SDC9_134295 [bioreactor metagenome]|uniref:Uncharacterized protein n=1 Tax=bioreactor metagenome TaxID=1076179 RepID=A0A645DCZ4_9ZZZZ